MESRCGGLRLGGGDGREQMWVAAWEAVGFEKVEFQLPSLPLFSRERHPIRQNGDRGLCNMGRDISVHHGCLSESILGDSFLTDLL